MAGRRLLTLLTILLTCSGGCGNPEKVAQEQSNLKPLVVFYGQYVGQHRGQPPANEGEFRAFLKSLPPSQLASFDVRDVDSLLVSARDKKPFVVRYGTASGPPGPSGPAVIAYEQEGVQGKRYVASGLGAVEEVDDAKFRSMVPDAK